MKSLKKDDVVGYLLVFGFFAVLGVFALLIFLVSKLTGIGIGIFLGGIIVIGVILYVVALLWSANKGISEQQDMFERMQWACVRCGKRGHDKGESTCNKCGGVVVYAGDPVEPLFRSKKD